MSAIYAKEGNTKRVDANYYERLKRKWDARPEKKLTPEEWKELREYLAGDMPAHKIYERMSRGRGKDFIQDQVALMGYDMAARHSRILREGNRKKNMKLYEADKEAIDKLIEEYYPIRFIAGQYNLSEKFTRSLIENSVDDYKKWLHRSRCKVNQGKSWAKKEIAALEYTDAQILALAMPWTSTPTPNQFHYWRYAA